MADAVIDETAEKHPMPAWLALLVILVCLVSGGGFFWWYLSSPVGTGSVILDPTAVPGALLNPEELQRWSNDAQSPNGVRMSFSSATDKRWRLKSGIFFLDVDHPATKTPTMTMPFRSWEVFSREDRELLNIGSRLRQDQAMGRFVKLTPEQAVQLQKLKTARILELQSQDETKLQPLWAAFESAQSLTDKQKAESALVMAVGEVGNRLLPDARKRPAEVKAILTPDQLKLMRENYNRRIVPAPATKPAGVAATSVTH